MDNVCRERQENKEGGMKTLELQITNSLALRHEIRELRRVHWGVSEITSFEEHYPEVFQIYLTLEAQSEEVQREAKAEQAI